MSDKTKKILIICLPIVIFITVLVLSYFKTRGDLWFNNVDIVGTLNEDGSLTVVETWDIGTTDDTYRGFYKEINVKDASFPGNDLVITNFKAKDNKTGKYFIQKTVDNPDYEYANEDVGKCSYIYDYGGGRQEIGVYFDNHSNKRSITFEYTLLNMCQGYDDAVVLYWKQFSQANTMYIKNYKCTLYLPGKVNIDNDTYAWFHCTDGSAMDEFKSNCIVYTANKVKSGTQIETRVLAKTSDFNLSAFSKRKAQNAKDSIIQQEKDWYDSWIAQNRLYYVKLIVSLIIGIVLAAAGVVLFIYFKYFYLKIKNEYPEYHRDIPEDETAAEMGHFYYYFDGGGKAQKNQSKLMSATILDLARRNYIELIPDVNSPEKYTISVNELTDNSIVNLKPHELTVYRLLAKVQNNYGHPFNMKEFKKFASSESHYSEIMSATSAFDRESGAKLYNGNYRSAKSGFVSKVFVTGFIIGLIGTYVMISLPDFLFLGAGMLLFGLFAFFGSPRVTRLTVEGEEEYSRARALGKYMEEFSNLKEYEIPALALWEEYMVYATMMGISEQVLKQLKLKYPELSDESLDSGYGYRHRGYFYTYMYLSRYSSTPFDLGRDLRTSMDTVKNTARAMQVRQNAGSSGSGFGHGGGGFGGGGGGFGGGGAGGRH